MNRELLLKVRSIIERNPERHYQGWWLTGEFDRFGKGPAGPGDLFESPISVEGLADLALEPVPVVPLDEENPVCGTKGCVAGWICLTTAPLGSLVDDTYVYLPGYQPSGELTDVNGREFSKFTIEYWAMTRAGLTQSQTWWLFASFRTRDQVLRGIDYLLEHPYAANDELNRQVGGYPTVDEQERWS